MGGARLNSTPVSNLLIYCDTAVLGLELMGCHVPVAPMSAKNTVRTPPSKGWQSSSGTLVERRGEGRCQRGGGEGGVQSSTCYCSIELPHSLSGAIPVAAQGRTYGS